jgi:hypothetical protein
VHIFNFLKMKKHSGMRPQDVVILLKIAAKGNEKWLMKDLSAELRISASEVSESINRSVIAGLLAQDKIKIMKLALFEFLVSGLPYVFPQRPGAMASGVPTAHSAPPLNSEIVSDEHYVWPYAEGKTRGQAIEPLYPTVPEAALIDPLFYELMALCDAIRAGKARERKIAAEELKKRFNITNL